MEDAIKLLLLLIGISVPSASALSTADRVKRHGYPVERHMVQTADAYILTMFRIPYPPRSNDTTSRPAVLLIHGLTSSSDCWVISGPGVSLAYKLVDAGYDVWLGNHRGTTYSRTHPKYSPLFQSYWNFEWHQLGVFDVPAMIDYILFQTNQPSLHYLGHSQGTTVLLVMASMLPQYNAKIKSAHQLAPVAYMTRVRGPIIRIAAPLVGRPSFLVELLGSMEFLPHNRLMSLLKIIACQADTPQRLFCSNLLFAFAGWHKDSINMTVYPDIIATHPAGASVNQVIHYMQEYLSGEFQQFDFGYLRNKLRYGSYTPPKYDLRKVTAPMFMYYATNDFLAHPLDVERLIRNLPNVVYSYKVPDPKWNHIDFLWAKNVDTIIFDKVITNINKMR